MENDKKTPQKHFKREETIEYLFYKLMAQISVYSGKKDGGLANLQDYIAERSMGQIIRCEICGGAGSDTARHKEDCGIIQNYNKYFKY